MERGLAQGFLLPLPRPNPALLRDLAIGPDTDRALVAAAWSASAMWTANAATVSPAPDTADGRCHLTPANLVTMAHRAQEWRENPFYDFIKQSYLLTSNWFLSTVQQNSGGLDEKSAHKLAFYTRQFVDAVAPTNFVLSNPTVLRETLKAAASWRSAGSRSPNR